MKFVPKILCAVALTTSSVVCAEVMDNSTVLALSKAGLSDDLIIAKINTEACGYDVSTSNIIALRNSGLSDKVISVMVLRCASSSQLKGLAGNDNSSDPKVRHSPGIYVMERWLTPNVLQPIRPSRSGGMKTSGNGSIVFPLVAKLVIPGMQSRMPVQSANPTFYFYFNPSDQKVSDFGTEASEGTQSPDEFSLVRVRPKKDTRELEMGRASAYGGSIVSFRKGLSLKNTIKFSTEEIGPGIHKVTPNVTLESGEYAFVFTGGEGSRIYDFSVYAQNTVRLPDAPPQAQSIPATQQQPKVPGQPSRSKSDICRRQPFSPSC